MSLNERLISAGAAACTTDSVDVFGDASGVALYTLDYDASDAGGLYDGTPTNVEFGVGGHINYGAGFNGSSSEIDLPVGLGASGNRARSLWINVSAFPASGGDTIYYIGQQGANDDYEYLNVRSDGTIRYQERHDAGGAGDLLIDSQTTISLNQWYNIVIVFDGLNRLMYINNSTALGNTGTKSTQTVNNSAYAGNLGSFRGVAGTATYDGSIDQVRIFSSALDSTQVTQLYNETACVYTCTTDTVDYPTTNVAYYKLDNSVEDETGTYDGTPTNINYAFGRFGQAAVFNGTSSYIYASNSVQQPTTNFSASVWVLFHQIKSSSVGVIGNFKTGVTPQVGWAISHQNGTPLQFWADGTANSDGGMVQSTSSIPTNEWIHVVGTYDGSNVKIYINGSLENTKSYTQTPATTDQPLVIGRWYGNFNDLYTDGQIDQVRIFSSALDSTQVESLYNEKPCEDTSTFKTVLYEGTGATQYISNVGMDLETGGGLIWIKNRDTTVSHAIVDNVRGIAESGTNYIASDTSTAQASSTNMPSSLETNGFFVQGNGGRTNTNNESYVAWVWKAGGDAVSNTDGTDITSQVSANTGAGFSIVKWTGTGDGTDTIGHGLDPNGESMIVIMKDLDSLNDWMVITNNLWSTPTTSYLKLNTTQAVTTGSGTPYLVNNTVFKNTNRNISGNDYIAYCFYSVAGYSKIGSYEGSGSSQSIYVTDDDTSTGSGGFEPSFVMVKNIDASANWMMYDARRDADGTINLYLEANTSDAEASASTATISPISNGFTIGNSNSVHLNNSGATYIYMAFK